VGLLNFALRLFPFNAWNSMDDALAERFGYTSDRIECRGAVPRIKQAIEL
jgi:hypothetical protein